MKQAKTVKDKKSELKTELTKWAMREGLLRPGQQLVFTLEVRGIPLVHDASQAEDEAPKATALEKRKSATKVRGMHIHRRGSVERPANLSAAELKQLIALFTDEPSIIGWLVTLIEDNKNVPVKKHTRTPYINKVLRENAVGGKKLTIVTKKKKAQLWVLKG